MKFALSTSLALLAAMGYAEKDVKMTSAKENLRNKVMTRKNRLFNKLRQEGEEIDWDNFEWDDWEPIGVLPPDRACLVWESSDEGDCEDQWYDWEDACWYDWTDMCQIVDDHWYAQDIDWVEPTVPEAECWYEDMYSDECWEQWMTVDSQCYGYSADGLPYLWTDVCDAVDLRWEFEDLRYWILETEVGDWEVEQDLALLRKMDEHVQKKQAAKKTGANVKLLATVAEPVKASTSKKHIRNSTIAAGVSITVLSGIAAFAFAMKRSAKKSEEEFLLQ